MTGFHRREALGPLARAFTQSPICCQRIPTVALSHQHDLELALPSRVAQLLALGAVLRWHQSLCLDGISHRPATPGGVRAHRVYLHGSGVLIMGRHTRRQGETYG